MYYQALVTEYYYIKRRYHRDEMPDFYRQIRRALLDGTPESEYFWLF